MMPIFDKPPFNAALDTPLYQQLYTHMRRAILSGELKGGLKLPSTRALAEELGVSRNTVLNAYGQLLAEGYLEGVEGSGTYVAHILPGESPTTRHTRGKPQPAAQPPPRLSANAMLQVVAPQMAPSHTSTARPFRSGTPALDAFPYKLWSRIVAQQSRRLPSSAFTYQDAAGSRPLREAISAHITVTRHVHCTPDQIIIMPGSQGALDLATRMLVNPGDPVWLEDPGYLGARGAFLGAGAKIVPVPVDDEGLVVEAGISRAPSARLVYLTPSHQFPLGVTMSLTRRLAILDWANRAGAYLLEDDYDSEYRFSGPPLAALQGLDEAARVIYIGTFSKVLFPSLRVGYLILPPSLIDPFLAMRRFTDIHVPVLEQAALTAFITEGHFVRHLRRMRILYAERRAALVDAASKLPLDIQSPEAGIHCIGWLPEQIDDAALLQVAAAHDLDLGSVSMFSLEPLARRGLLLGYGGFNVQEIQRGMQRLDSAMHSL